MSVWITSSTNNIGSEKLEWVDKPVKLYFIFLICSMDLLAILQGFWDVEIKKYIIHL